MAVAVAEPRSLFPWEVRALKTAHRRVHLNSTPPGHCRWCERPIVGKKGKYIGRPDPNRTWCRSAGEGRDCYYDYLLHSDGGTQFNYLERRRGLSCADCGVKNPLRWRKDDEHSIWGALPVTPWEGDRIGADYWKAVEAHRRACFLELPGWGTACSVSRVSALEVDHVVPLWRVAFKPIELRRPYFGPEFLQLLCSKCHKAKSKAEAAERARLRAASRAAAR